MTKLNDLSIPRPVIYIDKLNLLNKIISKQEQRENDLAEALTDMYYHWG